MPRIAVKADVAIFGAGVAGLWTAARLRAAGYSVVVVESRALGAGQTIASQGIIHGGIKYSLGGAASRASAAIAEMPGIWRACLRGEGEIDLRGARVISDRQYLWTTGGFGSRLMGLAASKVIRTGVERLGESERPAAFAGAPANIEVYRVDEPVLDPASLVAALAAAAGAPILLCDEGTRLGESGLGVCVRLRGEPFEMFIDARRFVLAAGLGNEALLGAFDASRPSSPGDARQGGGAMQRRPLHMVMARGRLPEVFGHCVGLSDKPRITITTQGDGAGRAVWYIGGQIAEEGVQRQRDEQVEAAKREIAACVPWADLSGVEWATLRIDRAEGTMGGRRPDEPVVWARGNAIAVWPTKLAFAPEAARRVIEQLDQDGVRPSGSAPDPMADLPPPDLATLPWEDKAVAWS